MSHGYRSFLDTLISPAPWGWRLEARIRTWHGNTHVAILAGILTLGVVALIQMAWVAMGWPEPTPALFAIALGGLLLIEAIRGAVLVPRRNRAQSSFGNLILDLPSSTKADEVAHHVRWAGWAGRAWGWSWGALAGLAALRSVWPASGIPLPTVLLLAMLLGLPWWDRRFLTPSSAPKEVPVPRWPDRHLRALRPYLAPADQTVLDHLRANPRWTHSALFALENQLMPLWKATVSESADPLPCLRAVLSVLPRRQAANALIDVIQVQKWDLLDALLRELPTSWWNGSGHPEPSSPVGDALLQMSYLYPDQVARYIDCMGPATWRMASFDRHARQFAGAQAARDTDRPDLWCLWTDGLSTVRWRAQLIREGQVPPSLPAATVATWWESPSALLALAHNLSDSPRDRPLVQGLLQALAQKPASARRAWMPEVQPCIADRPALQSMLDALVAQCPEDEQTQWQQAWPGLPWSVTRSAQRLAVLAQQPVAPVRTARPRA